ncbi:hypothetical protein HF521_019933 [Silurus meridionalis]|uniref:USP domain-containing protein n=2 Tax=Silurus meridionalis TaxID=175797 RepID=A0A8T0BHW8_SILME|nr:hypothetical protein HF521_019933 [Silurus meridionalis]
MNSIPRFWSKKYRCENVPCLEPVLSTERNCNKMSKEKNMTDLYTLSFRIRLHEKYTAGISSIKLLKVPLPKQKLKYTQTLCEKNTKSTKTTSEEILKSRSPTPSMEISKILSISAGELCTPVGLPNFGNTCYINSSLQFLFSADVFCRKLSKIMDNYINRPEATFLSCFVKLWKLRYSAGSQFGIRKDLLLLSLINEVTAVNPKFSIFEPNSTLTFICQCLEQIIKTVRMLGWKDDLDPRCPVGSNFDIKMKKVIKCSRCGFQQNMLYDSSIITVPLAYKSVDQCLYNIFNRKQLLQKCQKCGKQCASSILTFHPLPRFLILYLIRDTVDKNNQQIMLKCPVKFQTRLTINNTTQSRNVFFSRLSQIFRPRKENNKAKVIEKMRNKLDESASTYQLISVMSVITHPSESGHGIVDCYTHSPPQWWTCNDELISLTTEKDVLQKSLSNACLLLYEKMSTE